MAMSHSRPSLMTPAMNRCRLSEIFLFPCIVLFLTQGFGQNRKKVQAAQKDVHISGCPVKGVELGCLMLVASDGQTYDITAAPPQSETPGSKPERPKIGYLGVTVDANKSRDLNVCQQGVRLKDIEWLYTKQLCP